MAFIPIMEEGWITGQDRVLRYPIFRRKESSPGSPLSVSGLHLHCREATQGSAWLKRSEDADRDQTLFRDIDSLGVDRTGRAANCVFPARGRGAAECRSDDFATSSLNGGRRKSEESVDKPDYGTWIRPKRIAAS